MAFKSLEHFIKVLESEGELIRIKEYVNPHLEITEITDRISKSYGPALLFENTGYSFPVLINSMGTEKRMAMALGVAHLDDIARQIEQLFVNITTPKNSFLDKLKLLPQLSEIASWMPKVISGRGSCQEVVMHEPDLSLFPVLKCWPEDGGPFITLPVIQTKDLHTGQRNVGLYRMQVFSKNMTAMHWHRHKVSARHFNEYKKAGVRMPVVVTLGGDPAYTYSATAPLPEGVDEFILAGFIRKKRVELVQCLTQDMQVPADADIVIEGYIDPNEDFILEGPFGDHTGYYSLADYYPRFHVTCITHKKNAIYPATIVGIPPQEDAWIGKATERIFLAPIKMTMVPEIVDMVLPVEGVFHNLVIVKIKKEYPGQALKVMNALWGAGQMMFTKMMLVVDGNVNIHNNLEVAQYISQHVNPASDFTFNSGPTDVLDHSCSTMAFGGKMGIDATQKFPEEMVNEKPVLKLNHSEDELSEIFQNHKEITGINTNLLNSGIAVALIGIRKNQKDHIRKLAPGLLKNPFLQQFKVLIFLEHTINTNDIPDCVWRFANNVDPKRDHLLLHHDNGSTLIFDGTRKTKQYDGFQRDWPNILASDRATIERIDQIWNNLGLGEFISSPSLKYAKQLYEGGAVASE
jgi:4-hydroxy-3-polyprenylbenzoate decarboxylase